MTAIRREIVGAEWPEWRAIPEGQLSQLLGPHSQER
jgi:hypothetical protein